MNVDWGQCRSTLAPLELGLHEQWRMFVCRNVPVYREDKSVGQILRLVDPIKELTGIGRPGKPFELGYAGYMGAGDQATPSSVRTDAGGPASVGMA